MASSLETTFSREWLRRGALACALWPLSLLFRGLAAVRRGLYAVGVSHAERLPVPVVVVGIFSLAVPARRRSPSGWSTRCARPVFGRALSRADLAARMPRREKSALVRRRPRWGMSRY